MKAEKFVVPPLGGYCEMKRSAPPEGGTTNFISLVPKPQIGNV